MRSLEDAVGRVWPLHGWCSFDRGIGGELERQMVSFIDRLIDEDCHAPFFLFSGER